MLIFKHLSNNKFLSLLFSFSLFISIFHCGELLAQQPFSEEEMAEIARKKAELELEELEIKVQKARGELLRGSFPTPTDASKAPSGAITTDKVNIEGTTLAYEALGEVAIELSEILTDGLDLSFQYLIILDKEGVTKKTLALYQSYQSQIELYKQAYEEALSKKITDKAGIESLGGVGAGLSVLNLGLRGVIETLALFRTDIELKGVEVTIPETVLVSQLATQFRKNFNIKEKEENDNSSTGNSSKSTQEEDSSDSETQKKNKLLEKSCLPENIASEVYVYYPSLYSLDLVEIGGISPCQQIVLAQIQVLSDFKSQATTTINELEKKENKDLTFEDKQQLNNLKAINEQFKQFSTRLLTVNDEGINPLAILANGAKIEAMLRNDEGYLMFADLQSGGTNRTSRNIVASKIRYSGASIVNYLVFNKSGDIKLSGTHYHHTGFQKFKRGVTTSVSEPGNAIIIGDKLRKCKIKICQAH